MAESPGALPWNDFLVELTVTLPPDLDPQLRADLLAAELDMGREYQRMGVIYRIWRIPGALKNVAIWRAPDATALHAFLSALPLFNYSDIKVTALAVHPVEA